MGNLPGKLGGVVFIGGLLLAFFLLGIILQAYRNFKEQREAKKEKGNDDILDD
jgi:hypothetical protein